ncbi:MAG: carboxypeptidase-like regulatory domain-containing protein [Bacteroidales bacterium]|nr:carboxypeptidase-like regulatory domain-containing protein [Bacteroidales bacterium]MCF8405105.1 carboxypeptidase-like regulatory domain-containing protein [Bacteroidales bacterium]
MKKYFIIFIILNSIIAHGQIEFRGTVKTYEDSLKIPFAIICVDTIDTFKGFSNRKPIDSTKSNAEGNFSIKTKYSEKLNLIVAFAGYVPLTIKNIEIENNRVIDLGNIYLPNRGQWIEGYKPPEGETKRETRKKRKEWRKNNEPVPINWAGFSPDFFESYKGMDMVYLEYPINGIVKEFQIKDESLIIDYKEFIKE